MAGQLKWSYRFNVVVTYIKPDDDDYFAEMRITEEVVSHFPTVPLPPQVNVMKLQGTTLQAAWIETLNALNGEYSTANGRAQERG